MEVFKRFSARMDRRAHLMGAMMERLDVNIEAAGLEALGSRLENATRACLFCNAGDACERWLQDAENEYAATGPGFCPNRAFFLSHRS